MRAFLILLCFAAGWLVSFYGQPLIQDDPNVILILTTVFTVFAGFLVAIIAVLGDPALIPDGSWRTAEVRRNKIENELIVHVWLFVAYLVAIGFMFAAVLVHASPHVPNFVKIWIERIYMFFGASSFFLTFGLAKSMLAFQVGRIEAEIRKRRKEAGLSND